VGDQVDDDELRALHAATARAFLETRNASSVDPGDCHGMLCYRLAWHFLFAEDVERGLEYIGPALKHLRETWRVGDGERLALRAAHALRRAGGRDGEAVDMLLARAELLGLEGRRDEQGSGLDDALLLARKAKDAPREAQVLLESTRLYFVTHRLKRARETGRETLSVSHATGAKRIEARCQYLMGSVAYHEARYQDARQHMQRALELSRDLFDAATEAEALQALFRPFASWWCRGTILQERLQDNVQARGVLPAENTAVMSDRNLSRLLRYNDNNGVADLADAQRRPMAQTHLPVRQTAGRQRQNTGRCRDLFPPKNYPAIMQFCILVENRQEQFR
jgi:tetratricopeptide (TPR) repeat protein